MKSIMVPLALKTVSEANQRGNWRNHAPRRKSQRLTVGLVMRAHFMAAQITPPCVVMLTRIAPSSGLDDDNLRSAFKHVRDGIADALGIDDRDVRVRWDYAQRRGKPKSYGIEIAVSPA